MIERRLAQRLHASSAARARRPDVAAASAVTGRRAPRRPPRAFSERPVLERNTSSSVGACRLEVGDRRGPRRRARARRREASAPPSQPDGGRPGRRAVGVPKRAQHVGDPRRDRRRPRARARGRAADLRLQRVRRPVATIRPWSMIPMRSARTSASSRYCVVRKTVTPSSRASRATSSHSSERLCGSRPVVGSSRKRMRGPVDERQGQVQPALHAAGVAADLAVGGVDQAHPLEQRVAARPALGPVQALQRRLQPHVVAAGQERVERGLLERRADRRADRRPLAHDVVARDAGGARRRWQQRGEDEHGRRLPGAVGPQEAVDLAGGDAQVDAVDGARALLELADEALDLDPVTWLHVRRLGPRASRQRPAPGCHNGSSPPLAPRARMKSRSESRLR